MPPRTEASTHARQSLVERASSILSDAFASTENPAPTVLWWDRGGFLEDVLRQACEDLDGPVWRKAQGLPLSLRRSSLEEPERPAVWYVPEGKNYRDWFRDVAATGAEIEKDVLDLSAELYGVPRWDFTSVSTADPLNPQVASILKHELVGTRRPTLDELREELLTGGHGRPLDRLLISDWGKVGDSGTLDQLRDQLREAGVPETDEVEDVEALTEKARRWAVALWLQEEGVGADRFPDPYRGGSATARDAHDRLRELLQEADGDRTERIYLNRQWWPELVDSVDNPVRLARCPVDGAVDARLWSCWTDCLDAGEFEDASALARERAEVLKTMYGSQRNEASEFFRCWQQAFDIAELVSLSEQVIVELDREHPVEVYAREDAGAWRVDAAVRRLVVAGRPEAALPEWNPGAEALPAWREEIVGNRYLRHLEELALRTREAIVEGSFFSETRCVTQFWSNNDHREELAAGEEVALFFLDGLRLDLAYELAERLRNELSSEGQHGTGGDGRSWSVGTSRWRATVPSETQPGMGALLPGSTTSFSVDVVKGKLRARRSQRTLSTRFREDLLQREGWSVTRDWDERWQAARVAFIDSEMDDAGEAQIEEIEGHLSRRVETLATRIAGRLRQGGWSKAFVVTDHGFVLLPPGVKMEGLNPPDDAEAVSFRHAAPAGEEEGTGVRLEAGAPGLEYLESSVRVLVQPRQYFTKQGVSDRRYFHGGLSLQESLLLFLEIEKS